MSISIFRTAEEVQTWGDKDHPITRFKRYITEQGWWNDEQEKEWQKDVRKRVLTAFNQAEKEKLSHYHDLFEGVYKYVFFYILIFKLTSRELPEKLRRQRQELDEHLEEYGQHYPTDRCLTK